MSVVDLHFHNVPNSPKVAKYAISTVSQSYKAVIASISSFSSIHVCTLVVKPNEKMKNSVPIPVPVQGKIQSLAGF